MLMKSFLLTLTLSTAVICSALSQTYGQMTPDIKPFAVDIHTINNKLGDLGHVPLYETSGYVEIPPTYYQHDGTSLGIILVHSDYDVYVAFEKRCPHCYYDNGEIGELYIWTLLDAICNNCQCRIEGMVANATGQMTGYNTGTCGPRHADKYMTEKVTRYGNDYIVLFPRNDGY